MVRLVDVWPQPTSLSFVQARYPTQSFYTYTQGRWFSGIINLVNISKAFDLKKIIAEGLVLVDGV
jgi:hypothetical protein